MLGISDDGNFDALERACGTLFNRDSGCVDRTLDAAAALTAIAGEQVLGRSGVPDVAMTLMKMLALCTCASCAGKHGPSVAAVAVDESKRWFKVSCDMCYDCFVKHAVDLHDSETRTFDEKGEPVNQATAAGQAIAKPGSTQGMHHDDAFRRIRGLEQRSAVRLLQIGSGAFRRALRGHTASVSSVAYSPKGATVATGGWDSAARLWNAATGRCLHVLDDHLASVWVVAYSPDGKTIVSGSGDGSASEWDAATGERRRVFQGHADTVMAVAFSPQGGEMASGSDDMTVRQWDVQTGDCRRVRRGHTSYVWAVAYSPDGSTIASGSADKTLRLWGAESDECVRVLKGHTGSITQVKFLIDGATIVASSQDKTVSLWDVASGSCRRVLRGHTAIVSAVACSYDRSTGRSSIATGSLDKTVRLWSADSGECRCVLKGPADVYGVAFSGDGTTLVAGGSDSIARVWNTTTASGTSFPRSSN